MGIKRLGRKRLAAIEKLGILKDVSVGDGMSAALVSGTQHREGQKVTTDLVFDLGTSAATIKSGGTTEMDPLGTDSTDTSQLCKVTDAVFGIVTSLEVICLEAASDGDMTDFSITKSTNQTGVLGTPAASDATVTGSANSIVFGGNVAKAEGGTNTGVIAALGQHTIATFNDEGLKNQNLYLASGATAGTASAAAIGRIAIGSGFATSQLENGKTRIVVVTTDGTVTTSTINSSVAKGSSGMSTNTGTIGTSDVTTAAHFAESLAACLNAHSKLAAEVESDTTVKITQGTSGTAGNTSIVIVNGVSAAGAALTLDATVTNFAGGKTKGTATAMSSGKFLMRFTGFMVPDDL